MFKKIFFSLLFLLFSTSSTHAFDGFVTITNPNSGTFTEGDTVNITWSTSPNIDKVTIGYKSCESCLDWVAYNTANTGSYSWKVDVGNTTKTDFYLWIIAYETGQGSVTNTSGHFTVYQNPPINTGNSPTPRPSTSSSTNTPTNNPTPTPSIYRALATPKPTPTPLPRLTITTLILYQEFYFEDSRTTDLASIIDPKHVDNFTLDTAAGYTFIFAETLDLTDSKMLAGLQNTQDYWEYEAWFIWIEWEWWIKYDVTETINVEYKNEALTAYAPTLDTSTSPPTPTPKKAASPRPTPQILGSEAGKIKLAVNDGTPIKITPRVTLDTPESPVATDHTILTGKTSHSNLTWTLNHNGVKSTVSPTINADTGEFSLSVNNLTEGYNTFTVSYQQGDDAPVTLDPVSVLYTRTFWGTYGRTILLSFAFVMVFAAGIFAPRLTPTLRRYQQLVTIKLYGRTKKSHK